MNPEEIKALRDLENRIKKLEEPRGVQMRVKDHFHNGNDASRIQWKDVAQRREYIPWTIYGADAATAGNYGVFFIVPFLCTVVGFKEVHQTAGTDAGAVTLQLEKLTGTEALDAGVNVLSTALSLKAAANTVQEGALTTTLANRNLAEDDRLALKDSGVLTGVANVSVLVELLIQLS